MIGRQPYDLPTEAHTTYDFDVDTANLPGAELIAAGLDDLSKGRETVPALLVSIGSPRLRSLGFEPIHVIPKRRDSAVRAARARQLRRGARPVQRPRPSTGQLRAGGGVRALVDRDRIRRVMESLGRAAEHDGRIYLVGGTTAVLIGWRATTVDVDLVMWPYDDAVFRAIPALKERLLVNIELASPLDFIPVPVGWEDRGQFIDRFGSLEFYHFDFYAQALANVERGHETDLADVREMIQRALIDPARALEYFNRVEPDLYRFPAIDPPTFRRAVDAAFAGGRGG